MSTEKFIDLHIHTAASDGTDRPTALVAKAFAEGLGAIAITDHDTLAALPHAEEAGRDMGIKIIRGCELSTNTQFGELHILALWLPKDVSPLQKQIIDLQKRRHERNEYILNKLQSFGMRISMGEINAVAKGNAVGRPHIASIMVAKGYVKSMNEAFQKYLGINGKAYVPKEGLEPANTVRMLSSMGATVALAHPRLHKYPKDWMTDMISMLANCGMDAIEVWHSEHNETDVHICEKWANQFNLGKTGGSDYHGDNKPSIRMGVGKGNLKIPMSVLEELEERRTKRGLPC